MVVDFSKYTRITIEWYADGGIMYGSIATNALTGHQANRPKRRRTEVQFP